MHEGITDYLEIMHLAGVSDVKRATGARARGARAGGVSPPVVQEHKSGVTQASRFSREDSLGTAPGGLRPPAHTPPPTGGLTPPALALDGKAGQLQLLASEVAQCTQCRDLAESRTQTVFGVGNPDSSLVFLGEAPGADEDKKGEPFVGRAGQLLTDIIVKGMKLRREDVYICNILRCRPPGNRNPMPDEAAHCRPFLDRTLEIIAPKFICCLGAVAAKNLLTSEKTIGALRGKVWDYHGIKVVCTYHPAYLLRNPAAKADTWEDIKLLMREMSLHGE